MLSGVISFEGDIVRRVFSEVAEVSAAAAVVLLYIIVESPIDDNDPVAYSFRRVDLCDWSYSLLSVFLLPSVTLSPCPMRVRRGSETEVRSWVSGSEEEVEERRRI